MAFVYAAQQSWEIPPWIKLQMISTKNNSKLWFLIVFAAKCPSPTELKNTTLQPVGFFSTDVGALAIVGCYWESMELQLFSKIMPSSYLMGNKDIIGRAAMPIDMNHNALWKAMTLLKQWQKLPLLFLYRFYFLDTFEEKRNILRELAFSHPSYKHGICQFFYTRKIVIFKL